MAEKDRLTSLKERFSRSVEETARLKDAIAKEEKRLHDKEKRENEQWWRELSKKLEAALIKKYGTEYKAVMDQKTILTIFETELEGKGGEE